MAINTAPDAFFNLNDFAIPITWTVASSQDVHILDVIFDDPYFAAFDDGLAAVSSSTPTITMQSAKMPVGNAVNDSIKLKHPIENIEKTYKVKEIQRDGTGVSLLYLQLQ
jgi:hypothetical protein|tara:strand:- start:1965 stop:2294 length:330 start_codon:yes stop_codon:yes gene_type:complete